MREPVRSAICPHKGWAMMPVNGNVANTMPTSVPVKPTFSRRYSGKYGKKQPKAANMKNQKNDSCRWTGTPQC